MINLSPNNRAGVLTTMVTTWIKNDMRRERELEDKYVRQMWLNAFGLNCQGYDDDDYDCYDEDYWNDFYEVNHSSKSHKKDDDEDEYQNYFEPMSVRSDSITDDDELWYDVAHKYDTEEKSLDEIHKMLSAPAVTISKAKKKKTNKCESDVFKSAKKNKKHKETSWREEVLNFIDDDVRCIYFYSEPRKESSKQEFLSVDDFLAYCEENGITVDKDAKDDLEFYTQCHCGLDEYGLGNGYKDLRCARSYGELMYDLYGSDLFENEVAESTSHPTDDLPF